MDIRPTAVMVLGICAAAFSECGLPGIILGIIGNNKAKAYVAAHGETCGKVKTGSILSKVGIIVGSITLACSIIALIVWLFVIIGIGAGASLMNY